MTNDTKKARINGFKRSAIALAITAAFPISIAHAADEVEELPEVEIVDEAIAKPSETYKIEKASSFKYSKPLVETPKTITVISEKVMKDRGVTNLRDSLRGVSGISMAAGEGGSPTGDNVTIRGFSAQTDTFIDGIRDISGYSRDTYNTEAIEVSKGPGSSVSGRGSVGGSINLVTKQAQMDTFTTVGGLYGTESNHRLTVDTNHMLGDTTAFRINAMTTDGDVAGRDEVENGMDAIAVSFATGLGTDSRFTVSAEYQEQDRLPDYGIPWVPNYSGRADRAVAASLAADAGGPPSVSFDNFYGNVHRDFEEIKGTSVTGLYELDLNETDMLRFQARYGVVKRKSTTTAPRFEGIDVGGVDVFGLNGVRYSDEKTRDQETSMIALQAAYIGTVGKHDFSVGTEYTLETEKRWELDDFSTDNLNALTVLNDLNNPNPNTAFTGKYSKTGNSIKSEGRSFAIYAFDTMTLNDQWAISGGLRFENYESQARPDFSDPTVKHNRSDDMISWNAGVVYKVRENGNIYVGVGKSFNPSAEDLTARTRGNEIELSPEKSYGYELGTKWELFDDRLLASAALFRTEKTNARSDDPLDGGDGNDRDNILDGEQVVQGLELSAFGQITPKLSLTASYTYQDSEVTKATGDDKDAQEGNELARTPKNSVSVWASYQPTAKWTVGAGLEYVDKRYNSSDKGGRETAPSYHVFDAMVAFQATKKLQFQLNGYNLSDERYIDLVGGGHFVPGNGRSANLSAFYTF